MTPYVLDRSDHSACTESEQEPFFVQHFEHLITYLDQPGVPRTSNHAERANRRYRACTRPRYGWKTRAGQQALLIVLQGFDSS